VRVDRPVLTLGRSSGSDIPLQDRTLSRAHARIETQGHEVVLVDLGSRNGTSLNGLRLERPAPLKVGDRIVLGETVIDLSDEATTRVVIDPTERSGVGEMTLLRSARDLVKEADSRAMSARELARLNASLRILNEIALELMADVPLERLLSILMEKVFAYLQPDRGLLMLSDEGGVLRPEVVKFAAGIDEADIRLSQTLVQAVMEKKNGVLMIDSAMDARLAAAESIRLHGITSCLAAPLVVGEEVLGLIYLEARLGRRTFGEDDLRLLTSLASTAAIKIQNLRLMEESLAKQHIEREMALAWEIQRRLLPERAPELPHTELSGRTLPSRTVSGDWYDFFVRSDGTVDVVVADVCGKGMGASILAASVQAAFQVWAGENTPPDKMCAGLNDLVHRRTSSEKFVTFFGALYDPETGALLFTNAGHNPGILVRASGETELLKAHGMPLGLFPGRVYSSGSLTLRSGDLLVLYTDGLTEAANAKDEEFGLERLVAVGLASRGEPVLEVERAIEAAISEFVGPTPYADDRTLVLLRRT
jgi:serine phosphatase RsbU (regulator of sigma subunit)